ncbi:glycosyltransferase [Lapidilactobacillus gannanensis]|uniref:Glycosyltransferase n=1 Tax=Lapidilactobacillus gannanensis TaxID=2486002 RepID=A0ABW4BQI4_9LACO|nr:glycosyltransferase [Lapidilactobacillus gannanensis]
MAKLTVIVVTYQRDFRTTPSAAVLLQYAQQEKINLIVFDNKFVGKKITGINVVNIQSSENLGLAKAYNFAFCQSKKAQSKWLLLLDHDTEVSQDYLERILNSAQTMTKAILPFVVSKNTVVSPLIASKYISLRDKNIPKPGTYNGELMAINSGSVLSVAAMDEIGGFNEKFPLDFLDHWLFWRLNQLKSLNYYLIDEKIGHDLSVQSPNKMNFDRYIGILQAEEIYYTEYNRVQKENYVKNLRLRAAKQFLIMHNRKFWRATVHQYFTFRRELKK